MESFVFFLKLIQYVTCKTIHLTVLFFNGITTLVLTSMLNPSAVEESALLSILPSHRGDAGQHDDATHHTEIQRQPGCCQECQPQSGSLHQGQELVGKCIV